MLKKEVSFISFMEAKKRVFSCPQNIEGGDFNGRKLS
jgi:hypothetical protein